MIKKTLFFKAAIASLFVTALLPTAPFQSVSALAAQSINVTNASTTTVRSYYSSLNNLSVSERQGDNLLKNLKPILKAGHQSFSYATVWDWTKITDRDWTLSPLSSAELSNYAFADNPYVNLLYRADNGTATAAQHADEHGKVIDREHVWPKSLGNFGESAPAGTDLHHLMLADSKNNQQGHSNFPYGNVNPSNYTAIDSFYSVDNPSNVGVFTGKRGLITYGGTDYTVYEPQDRDKGNIARAMFYMAARYSSFTSGSDPYLKLSNTPDLLTTTSSSITPGQAGFLDTLLSWHTLDPVDDYEIKRNNLIYYNAQFNRNPFIDYPSWVDSVWGSKVAVNPATDPVTQYGQTMEVTPTAISLTPNTFSLGVNDTTTFAVNVTPINASTSVTWSSSNNSVAAVSNGTVTAIAPGNVTITATSTLDANIKGTATITVMSQHVKSLVSIGLTGVTSSIKYDETYPIESITVTATYDDSSTADVTAQASIQAPNTLQIGPQTLSVSYSENSITKYQQYDVFVTNNGVLVGDVTQNAPDLFFSEYIEGSSNNKALEIFNATGAAVDLSNYSLGQYNNGSTSPVYPITLTGTLSNLATFTIVNSSASTPFLSKANLTTSSSLMGFNGNDAIALRKGTDIIDLIGVIGSATDYAINKTLVRKASVSSPVSTWDEAEWDEYPVDTSTYLGSHTYQATTQGISASTQANAWATYFLSTTSFYCEEQSGDQLAAAIWTSLGDEYCYLDSTTKALFAATTASPDMTGIAGAKARYQYLITKYGALYDDNFMTDGDNHVIFSAFMNNETRTYQSLSLNRLMMFGFVTMSIYGFVYYKRTRQYR